MIKHTMLSLVLASLGGCASITMQPPQGVHDATVLPVTGHSGNLISFREKDLTLGAYRVTNIDRDWDRGSSQSAGPWARDAHKKAFRFDLKSQQRTLHAECVEQAVTHEVAGFGKSKATFKCSCAEGDGKPSTLELINGVGKATLSDGDTFEVAALYDSEQGPTTTEALGYHFKKDGAEGAVDVTVGGRAWVPKDIAEEQLFELVCHYGALFLYRPTKEEGLPEH